MTTNVFPSNLQWVGAAKEATPGTAEAAPTFWIPVDKSSLKWKPDQKTLTDGSLRGLMGEEYQQVAGMRSDTLAYKTYLYMDSVYQHFLALLGTADAITGTADPYTHKCSLYNGSGTNGAQPPSFTLFYTDAAGKTWKIAGCMIDTLKVEVKVDELVTLDVTWRGFSTTAVSPLTNTPSTSKPMPSWNAIITFAGSPSSAYSDITLEYKRNTEMVPTINNSQAPITVGAFGLSVAFSGTAVYQGSLDPNLVDYLTNVQPTLSVKMAPVGDAVHSLTLQHSLLAFDSAEVDGKQKYMQIAAAGKALMNATDALDSKQSPAQAIFLTTQSTAF